MSKRDVIVVGASAGGVEALQQLVSTLPVDFAATIFVVLHVPAHGSSVLPSILSRACPLPAVHAGYGMPIKTGYIYIAPPNHHLIVKSGFMEISHGPKENGHRPAIDPMFRSASRVFGNRVIGIVLSGVMDDGSGGLIAVKMRGGLAIVQHPEDAMYDGMPRNALEHVQADYVLPVVDIGRQLPQLIQEDVPASEDLTSSGVLMDEETKRAEINMETMHTEPPGKPASLACPECGGTLWEIEEGDMVRYRCRVGHAFTAQSLLAEQSEALEDAFWVAYRALEESAELAQRMAERARLRGHTHSVAHFEERARDARQRAELVRDVLLKHITNPLNEFDNTSKDASAHS